MATMDPREPIDADTTFDVGSVSKQFTATAILLLEAEAKLSLDDAIGDTSLTCRRGALR